MSYHVHFTKYMAQLSFLIGLSEVKIITICLVFISFQHKVKIIFNIRILFPCFVISTGIQSNGCVFHKLVKTVHKITNFMRDPSLDQ